MLTMPLPFGEDARRLMQGPALILFFGLGRSGPAAGSRPTCFRYNRALAEARNAGSLRRRARRRRTRLGPEAPSTRPPLYLLVRRVLMDQGQAPERPSTPTRVSTRSRPIILARAHARRAEALRREAQERLARVRTRARAPRRSRPRSICANLTAWAEAARAASAGDLPEARCAAAADRAQALAPDDETVRLQIAANNLLEKRIAERDSASRSHGRKGMAFKPRLNPR